MSDSSQQGFTLVELVLAMTVFSFMLLLITAGFINIVHLYESGLSMRTTQQNTRFGLDDIISTGHGAYEVDILTGANETTSLGWPSTTVCFFGPTQNTEYYVDPSGNLHKLIFTQSIPSGACPASLTVAQTLSDQTISSSDVAVVEMTATVTGPGAYTAGRPQSVNIGLAIAPSASLPDQITSHAGGGAAPQCIPGVGLQFCSVTLLQSSVSLQGVPQ